MTVLTFSIPILGITLLTDTQRGDDRVSIVASKRGGRSKNAVQLQNLAF